MSAEDQGAENSTQSVQGTAISAAALVSCGEQEKGIVPSIRRHFKMMAAKSAVAVGFGLLATQAAPESFLRQAFLFATMLPAMFAMDNVYGLGSAAGRTQAIRAVKKSATDNSLTLAKLDAAEDANKKYRKTARIASLSLSLGAIGTIFASHASPVARAAGYAMLGLGVVGIEASYLFHGRNEVIERVRQDIRKHA